MKKTISFFLSMLFMLSFSLLCFASQKQNIIFGNKGITVDGENLSIPIEISNNNGFMGFSITLTYDDDVLSPSIVKKGEMLSGILNDSIGTADKGTVKVVYCGTEDCKKDGILFTVEFKQLKTISNNLKISISYSQDDTFNENWQDVVFDCEDIIINNSAQGNESNNTEPTTRFFSRILQFLYRIVQAIKSFFLSF